MELRLTLTKTHGAGLYEKLSVQKSHPYRVGGLFRHLGQIQILQKLQFGLFGLLFKQYEKCAAVQGVLCELQRCSLLERVTRCKKMSQTLLLEQTLKTLGERITCQRCLAHSKRTKQQCQAPAAKGKTKCRFHGGASTGPKTEQGRQRCAEAKSIHGNETRKARIERAEAMRRLRVLEDLGHQLGFMSGSHTRGVRPNCVGETYPELQVAILAQLGRKFPDN